MKLPQPEPLLDQPGNHGQPNDRGDHHKPIAGEEMAAGARGDGGNDRVLVYFASQFLDRFLVQRLIVDGHGSTIIITRFRVTVVCVRQPFECLTAVLAASSGAISTSSNRFTIV